MSDNTDDATEWDPRTVPYPGGKTALAPWITTHFPPHECYVEPFAGSAAVLAEKDRSRVEVLNDTDEMLIRAYRTIRSQLPELRDRLSEIPFARSVHQEWATHLNTGDWPDDDVEATARWLFLRYSQHSAKLTAASGFKTSKKVSSASAWANAKKALPAFADRLDMVLLESDDWETVADRYDGEETLTYLDPPYAEGKGNELYRHSGEFDHERLVDWLADANGDWVLSYESLPECLNTSEYTVVERQTTYNGSIREGESPKEATERLVCNFDPADVAQHTEPEQASLTEAL